MRTWTEDEDRSEVAIWLGDFKTEEDVNRYAKKQFRKELKLPADPLLDLSLKSAFSAKRGDLPALIESFLFSQSYFEPFKKAAQEVDCSSFNGAIALFDYFTDDEFADATSKVEFIDYFPYDQFSDKLPSQKPDYLNEDRVSVWFGTFESKDKFHSYFNLPDHIPPTEDVEYQNDFAEDFRIEIYEEEFAAYNLSRAMRQKPFEDLISPIPMSKKLQKAIVKAATDAGLVEGNAIYVAFELDYDVVKANLKKKPKSRHEFQYVGVFDSPQRMSKPS